MADPISLAALRALLDASTPGPWYALDGEPPPSRVDHGHRRVATCTSGPKTIAVARDTLWSRFPVDPETGTRTATGGSRLMGDDADAIVALRNHADALLELAEAALALGDPKNHKDLLPEHPNDPCIKLLADRRCWERLRAAAAKFARMT